MFKLMTHYLSIEKMYYYLILANILSLDRWSPSHGISSDNYQILKLSLDTRMGFFLIKKLEYTLKERRRATDEHTDRHTQTNTQPNHSNLNLTIRILRASKKLTKNTISWASQHNIHTSSREIQSSVNCYSGNMKYMHYKMLPDV